MGFDISCYAGPYFACGLKHEKKLIGFVKITACANEGCAKHKKLTAAAFCSACGAKITEVDVEKFREKIEADEIEGLEGLYPCHEDYEEYAKKYNIHMWYYGENNKILTFSNEGCVDYFPVITGEIIESQKKTFLNNYKKEFLILKEIYGEDQVEVRWGVLNHCSY